MTYISVFSFYYRAGAHKFHAQKYTFQLVVNVKLLVIFVEQYNVHITSDKMYLCYIGTFFLDIVYGVHR